MGEAKGKNVPGTRDKAKVVNLHPNGATHLRLVEPPKHALFSPQTS